MTHEPATALESAPLAIAPIEEASAPAVNASTDGLQPPAAPTVEHEPIAEHTTDAQSWVTNATPSLESASDASSTGVSGEEPLASALRVDDLRSLSFEWEPGPAATEGVVLPEGDEFDEGSLPTSQSAASAHVAPSDVAEVCTPPAERDCLTQDAGFGLESAPFEAESGDAREDEEGLDVGSEPIANEHASLWPGPTQDEIAPSVPGTIDTFHVAPEPTLAADLPVEDFLPSSESEPVVEELSLDAAMRDDDARPAFMPTREMTPDEFRWQEEGEPADVTRIAPEAAVVAQREASAMPIDNAADLELLVNETQGAERAVEVLEAVARMVRAREIV
ncbi:MAG: hypothetical protein ACT4P7_09475, partial [Gemmatimonadaceae bacterium]